MKKILLMILTVMLLISCSRRYSVESEEYAVAKQAEIYFQKAMASEKDEVRREYFYRSASLLEELITTGKLDNAYLYYNLANSWMNSGNTGRAILNYRKAEQRMPGNQMVKNNLSIARSSVESRIERTEVNALLRTIFFIHYDLSFNFRYLLMISFISIFITASATALFKKKKILKNIQLIAGIIILSFGISLFLDMGKPAEGVIVFKEVTARKGDSAGYESSFTENLTEGVEFSLISERNQWYYIELTDGNTCWIPGNSAELIE